jgi:DNA-binding transcriptional MerR regulator
MDAMTVSQLAERTGTTPDTVRYYERIGVLPAADRSPGGYRLFDQDDVDRVRFVKRAQRFGLQLDEIRELLEIRERGLCPCGHARELLTARRDAVAERIGALERLRSEIDELLAAGVAADGWPCGTAPLTISARPDSLAGSTGGDDEGGP